MQNREDETLFQMLRDQKSETLQMFSRVDEKIDKLFDALGKYHSDFEKALWDSEGRLSRECTSLVSRVSGLEQEQRILLRKHTRSIGNWSLIAAFLAIAVATIACVWGILK